MSAQIERLYSLLPSLYRQRDQLRGEPLRALLSVLDREFQALEADTLATYANWFIQTCDSWAIPYIADLVGVRDMSQDKHIFPTQRRQVGNTIAYRRRKGTLAVLEHAVADGTGWAAAALEFGRDLSITQDLKQVRAGMGRTVDLRDVQALADPEGAFASLTHAAEARRIDPVPAGSRPGLLGDRRSRRRGKYNLPNVGLFFWRLFSFAMSGNAAHLVDKAEQAARPRYTFHPLGQDMQLFTRPEPTFSLTERVGPANVPAPITRAALSADLQTYRQRYRRLVAGSGSGSSGGSGDPVGEASTLAFGPGRSIHVRYEQASVAGSGPTGETLLVIGEAPVHPSEIVVADLEGWDAADAAAAFEEWDKRGKKIALDPETGRLVWLAAGIRPGTLRVDYCYGFSGEIGGGPYRRSRSDREAGDQMANCTIPVAHNTAIDTLGKALALWKQAVGVHADNLNATIRILDSGVYDEAFDVRLPPRSRLAIVAENGLRPVLTGGPEHRIDIVGEGKLGSKGTLDGPELTLNGLLIDAQLRLLSALEEPSAAAPDGKSASPYASTTGLHLSLEHCTLMPRGLTARLDAADARTLRVTIDQSIVGPLRLPATADEVTITKSIVDGGGDHALCGPDMDGKTEHGAGPAVSLDQVTVFGEVYATRLLATDSLLYDPVTLVKLPRSQIAAGDVSFSYLPPESLGHDGLRHPQAARPGTPPPVFTSRRYGDPAYAQLGPGCPLAILGGSADGSEMGAFHDLYQLQAEQNLSALLDEYLPLGLSAGVFYLT